jgi:glyoxylase-like metal-dependent hydrolase (beta-lactamase superfamily II)
MEEWFTVTAIDGDTYAISEYGHWENVHSYLVIASTSAALIDTGLGIGDIRSVVTRLTDLPVQVLTTHVHNDHIGGHGLFSSIAVHKEESMWLENGVPLPPEQVKAWLMKEPFRQPAPVGFDPNAYRPFRGKPTRTLSDGDCIDLGNRHLKVIHTPGHSPGHICLYEENRGYLFAGDLLYSGKLDAYYPSTDPAAFAKSVERLSELVEVRRILPGHYTLDLGRHFLQRVHSAFNALSAQDLLKHGTGIHDFGDFKIHL